MALGLRFVQVNGLRVHSVWGSEREREREFGWFVMESEEPLLKHDRLASRLSSNSSSNRRSISLKRIPCMRIKDPTLPLFFVAVECCFVHTLSLDYLTKNIISLFQHVATQISNLLQCLAV